MTDPRPDRRSPVPAPRTQGRPPPITVAIVNLKGGAGKTTSAAFVAHALRELGRRVLAVDADPQGSLLKWQELGEWPIPCVGLPSASLHRDLPGIVDGQFEATVIDTPGTANGRPIALSALRAATHVIVPCAPTPVEFAELGPLRALIEDATDLRPSGRPPVVGALLVRVIPGAGSTGAYRAAALADGWRVLRPVIGRLERYAQAFGDPVPSALATGYGDAVLELLDLEQPTNSWGDRHG